MQCFFGTHALSPPPPPHHCTLASTMLTVKHWWHWKTVVIKCHQYHQLLFKICYLYVTNVYSYVLMMQIKFVLYCMYNVSSLQMPPFYWGSANSLRSGTDWSLTRAGSPLKLLVSIGLSSASFNLRSRRFLPSSRIWTGGLPGCLTSQRIYNPIYLMTRISSLLESTHRDICSSHAVLWRNSRCKWLPSSLTSNWERGMATSQDLTLMCLWPREKNWEWVRL